MERSGGGTGIAKHGSMHAHGLDSMPIRAADGARGSTNGQAGGSTGGPVTSWRVLALAAATLAGCSHDAPYDLGGGAPAAGDVGGVGGSLVCAPGEVQVCVCETDVIGERVCNQAGSGFSSCPACHPAGDGGAGGGTNADDACIGHCFDGAWDCGETDLDCGGVCAPCTAPGPPVYTEDDCIASVRNGSEICDDAQFSVDAPGTGLVVACLNDGGGVVYIATNTGPPDPVDSVRRCQGWELTGQNAWEHLDYVYQFTCDVAQAVFDVDLSAHVGQGLYVGAHDLPQGGGHMTHICLAWKK